MTWRAISGGPYSAAAEKAKAKDGGKITQMMYTALDAAGDKAEFVKKYDAQIRRGIDHLVRRCSLTPSYSPRVDPPRAVSALEAIIR